MRDVFILSIVANGVKRCVLPVNAVSAVAGELVKVIVVAVLGGIVMFAEDAEAVFAVVDITTGDVLVLFGSDVPQSPPVYAETEI